jgi:hypothetical protein
MEKYFAIENMEANYPALIESNINQYNQIENTMQKRQLAGRIHRYIYILIKKQNKIPPKDRYKNEYPLYSLTEKQLKKIADFMYPIREIREANNISSVISHDCVYSPFIGFAYLLNYYIDQGHRLNLNEISDNDDRLTRNHIIFSYFEDYISEYSNKENRYSEIPEEKRMTYALIRDVMDVIFY